MEENMEAATFWELYRGYIGDHGILFLKPLSLPSSIALALRIRKVREGSQAQNKSSYQSCAHGHWTSGLHTDLNGVVGIFYNIVVSIIFSIIPYIIPRI